MRKLLVAVLASVLFVTTVHAAEKKVITLESLQDMFADMKAKTKWNLDGDMLWGYYFTDPDTSKLEKARDVLVKAGYRLVDIYPTDDKKTRVLHVEKVEHHTPESLNRRNQEFYKLADQLHLESYDGMDVGPADAPLPR